MTARSNKSYSVGDGATEIVDDPITEGVNRFMLTVERLAEKLAAIGADLPDWKLKDRQRSREDLNRKRKQLMKNRGRR